MNWRVAYFDDNIDNIECFQLMLEDDLEIIGCVDPLKYNTILCENFIHAMVIDVHMPVMDGYTLYQNIIKHPLYNGCPVFFISGDDSDENKIKSHEQGGVDFLPRTLAKEEIFLRLSSKIKLFLKLSMVIELGNLKIDAQAFRVYLDKLPVNLTLIEMRMISALLRSFPHAITKNQMLRNIWGHESEIKAGTINTHLTNLRNKIDGWDFSIKVKEENIYIQKN